MASYKDLGAGKFKLYVELGYDAKGKRKRRTKVVEASGPRAAGKLLSAFEQEVYNSQHIEVEKAGFSDFVDRWYANYVLSDLESSTADIYAVILRSITPYFEKMKLKDIRTLHIIEYFKTEKEAGRGSLEKKYNILQSIFKHAVEWKVLVHDPMEGVTKPKSAKIEMQFYDKDEIAHLLELVKTLKPRHRLMVKLTLAGGLRRGELLGISYDAVDFAKNQIHIKRSLQHSKKDGFRLKGTKTGENRIVSFPPSLMKEFHNYYIKQLNLKMEMGSLWKGFKDIHGEEVMLFVSDEYGQPYSPAAVTRFWGNFMKRNEEIKRIRFQDLRHSSASLILSEGVNMKVLQKRLGHKNIKTTLNVYSHITEKDDEKASNVFKDLL